MRMFFALVVAFIVLSALFDNSAPQRALTGAVFEYQPGQRMSIVGETLDPMGGPFPLRETTAYEGLGDSAASALLRPGVRVTVWYRSIGERRFVADKVRVLPSERSDRNPRRD